MTRAGGSTGGVVYAVCVGWCVQRARSGSTVSAVASNVAVNTPTPVNRSLESASASRDTSDPPAARVSSPPHLPYSFNAGNESVPKVVVNNTTNLFLNCFQHFANFKP